MRIPYQYVLNIFTPFSSLLFSPSHIMLRLLFSTSSFNSSLCYPASLVIGTHTSLCSAYHGSQHWKKRQNFSLSHTQKILIALQPAVVLYVSLCFLCQDFLSGWISLWFVPAVKLLRVHIWINSVVSGRHCFFEVIFCLWLLYNHYIPSWQRSLGRKNKILTMNMENYLHFI